MQDKNNKRVVIYLQPDTVENHKIKALKEAYALKHKKQIPYSKIVEKLVNKAKLKDIE